MIQHFFCNNTFVSRQKRSAQYLQLSILFEATVTSETTLPLTITEVITVVVHPGDDIFYLDVLDDAGGGIETIPLFTANENEARMIAVEVVRSHGDQFETDVRFMRAAGTA